MKKLFTLLMAAAPFVLNAQVSDSVAIGSSNKVFYSLENDEQGTVVDNDWDLAIASYAVMTSSIRINGGYGTAVYMYTGGDTSAWATLDTAGLGAGTNWMRCYDSDTSYEPSAFEFGATGFPNYGWGNYNPVSHDVVGVALFAVKLRGSNGWKKVWIQKLGAISQDYEIRTANLDGSNEDNFVVDRTGLSAKNFLYVDLTNGNVLNVEPDRTTYDLVFHKYEAPQDGGIYYPASGVTSNRGVKVAEARGVAIGDAVYTDYVRGTNIHEIGWDWKALNMQTFQFAMVDSLSYFVEDLSGNVWHLAFTAYRGGQTGKFYFVKNKVQFASVEDESGKLANFNVYPNPTADIVNVVYTMENSQSNGTIRMFDMNGRMLFADVVGNNNSFNNYTLNVQELGLTPGIYMIQLEVAGKTAIQKVIVK